MSDGNENLQQPSLVKKRQQKKAEALSPKMFRIQSERWDLWKYSKYKKPSAKIKPQ